MNKFEGSRKMVESLIPWREISVKNRGVKNE